MKSHTNKILESIKQALTEHLPKGGKALLFGSQARGAMMDVGRNFLPDRKSVV